MSARRPAPGLAVLVPTVCAITSLIAAAQDAAAPGPSPIPEENRAGRSDDPPPRPELGDASERARVLLEAIVADDPARAQGFFFPRDAFRVLKGIAQPDRYWQVLWRHYEADIHALSAEVPGDATFDRLVLNRRGGWVRVREEANALPYWCSRHSQLYYHSAAQSGAREGRLEIRTLITWGTRWYVTHLR
ncbi:MAG: hypothetical protein IT378_04490 [Sandaracinaceae bacterium]|nr:hypothetical protein [Sandaracinaceae bacterium]